MRLAEISDRTLDWYDLARVEARQEARAGQLWATPDRQHVAVAPTAEAAAWMLGTQAVEPVTCSALPEQEIVRLGRLAASRARGARYRRTGRLEVELPRGGIGVPTILGESAWQSSDNVRPSMQSFDDALDALRYATTQGAPLVWSQGSGDDVHPTWPETGPLTQEWVRRILEEP